MKLLVVKDMLRVASPERLRFHGMDAGDKVLNLEGRRGERTIVMMQVRVNGDQASRMKIGTPVGVAILAGDGRPSPDICTQHALDVYVCAEELAAAASDLLREQVSSRKGARLENAVRAFRTLNGKSHVAL